MENKKTVWSRYGYSNSFIGTDLSKVFEKLQELRTIVEGIAPESELMVFLADKRSKFNTIPKLIDNLIVFNRIYNERTILSNPEVAQEVSEIIEAAKKINKIIAKRKAKRKKVSKKEEAPTTTNEGDENASN